LTDETLAGAATSGEGSSRAASSAPAGGSDAAKPQAWGDA
jgi:hypothetical protein